MMSGNRIQCAAIFPDHAPAANTKYLICRSARPLASIKSLYFLHKVPITTYLFTSVVDPDPHGSTLLAVKDFKPI